MEMRRALASRSPTSRFRLLAAFFCFAASLYFLFTYAMKFQSPWKTFTSRIFSSKHYGFDNKLLDSQELLANICFENNPPTSIEGLEKAYDTVASKQNAKCKEYFEIFQSIYHFRGKMAHIKISETFMIKVKKWLQDNERLVERTQNQNILFVDNVITQESVVFNPVRSMRPGVAGGGEADRLQQYIDESKESCDFCNYKKFAAQDLFGILESKHASMVSNTFKIEKYHGMLLLRNHNPTEFSLEEFVDAMQLALRWFETAHKESPTHNYRFMYWDILPKASASQIHPHIHATLGDYAYYAKWHHLHTSAVQYAKTNGGSNYWTNLFKVHHLLGLAVSYGSASAIAYLTPQKDYEVLVISEKPNTHYFRLLHFVYRAFIDDLKLLSLSSGFVYPPLNQKTDNGNVLPAITRIVYRGPLTSSRSDISSFDLFGTANVNKDPFVVIKAVKASVEKRSKLVPLEN